MSQQTAQPALAGTGYAMPAEWEPHSATWITWPHNASDWPGRFAPIPWVYAEIAKKITAGEKLRVLVDSADRKKKALAMLKRAGVDWAQVEFFPFPTNRGWTRDYGPIFVRGNHPRQEQPLRIVRFRFNGWAKYPDWKLDDAVPELAAGALALPLLAARWARGDYVLEGGAIDVNGQGTVLTTEECLLDEGAQARNPGISRADSETALRASLGVQQVIWLGRGIAGDDTHGHVDDICRFTGPSTVVLCQETNPYDVNYAPLQENRERLQDVHLASGEKLEVVALPMPSPLYFDGQRLPASYANFYACNAAVLAPTFNDVNDRKALGILSELFTDRPVVGINAVELVWGLGALHCMTQQQPA
jgi:agmatine deiminase